MRSGGFFIVRPPLSPPYWGETLMGSVSDGGPKCLKRAKAHACCRGDCCECCRNGRNNHLQDEFKDFLLVVHSIEEFKGFKKFKEFKPNPFPPPLRGESEGVYMKAMKKTKILELVLKVIVAAITAALTAITTTS